jgi:thiamine kinase-like enzyme
VRDLAAIIARLEAQLGPASAPVALEGGLTNRNYRVRFGDRDTVVRLCGKDTAALGIDRSTEALATERAAQLRIGPPVLARLVEEDVLVCGFIEGCAPTAGQLRLRKLGVVASKLRAFHESGPLPTSFAVFELVERQRSAVAPDDYDALLGQARRIEAALAGHAEHAPVACHNDLLTANFILGERGLRLIDWEYAGMNDRYFDLGNFAVNNALSEDDETTLLAAYFHAPATARRLAALRLMRFMSDFREAMWGVAQQSLSDLGEVDYVAYAGEHFGRLRATAADPRFEEWISVAATT